MNALLSRPKSADKRRFILESAVEAFAKEGYRTVDVQRIADHAGVGKGTIYRHFASKEGLFVACFEFCRDRLFEHIKREFSEFASPESYMEANGAVNFFRRIARVAAQFYQLHPEAIEIIIQKRVEFRHAAGAAFAISRDESHATLKQFISLAIARGEFKEADVQSIADAFGDQFCGSLLSGLAGEDNRSVVDRVMNGVEVMLRGLAQDPPA